MELSEESLSRWIVHLKDAGNAPSHINSKFAGVCTVLECRSGEPVRGAKFLKKTINRWLKKQGASIFEYCFVIEIFCHFLSSQLSLCISKNPLLINFSFLLLYIVVVKKSHAFTFGNIFDFIEKVDLNSKQQLVYGAGLILGIYGVHRISEVHAYKVRMISADGGGNGLWIDFDGATKTAALGAKSHTFLLCYLGIYVVDYTFLFFLLLT